MYFCIYHGLRVIIESTRNFFVRKIENTSHSSSQKDLQHYKPVDQILRRERGEVYTLGIGPSRLIEIAYNHLIYMIAKYMKCKIHLI